MLPRYIFTPPLTVLVPGTRSPVNIRVQCPIVQVTAQSITLFRVDSAQEGFPDYDGLDTD